MPDESELSVGAEAIRLVLQWADRENAPWDLVRSDSSLTITPHDKHGFSVSIDDDGDEATIGALQWHSHYDNPEEAANQVLGLLTPYMRVIIAWQKNWWGKRSWKGSYVECFEPYGWSFIDAALNPNNTDSLGLVGEIPEGCEIWIHQQDIVRPDIPYDQSVPGAKLDANGLPLGSRLGVLKMKRVGKELVML